MKLEQLVVGKLYLLRGGHVMRYQGPWSSIGSEPIDRRYRLGVGCLAFRNPSEGVSEPAVGYSCLLEDVLYLLGPVDVEWMLKRLAYYNRHRMVDEAREAALVIEELAPGTRLPDNPPFPGP